MTQAELLRYLVEALEGLGIQYMVAGSHAAMYYGEPRLTRDLDVVATLDPERLAALLQRFPHGEFYVDAEAAREAVEASGQLNIIHPGSGLKIDVRQPRHRLRPDASRAQAEASARPGGRRLLRAPRGRHPLQAALCTGRRGASPAGCPRDHPCVRTGPDERYIAQWADRLGLAAVWEQAG